MPAHHPARRERKLLVEDSFALSPATLREALAARVPGPHALIVARRPDNSGSDTLEVRVRPVRADGRAVEIAYERALQTRRYRLRLVPIPQHFGGVRWTVACPLRTPNGQPCHRRARALYLPPGRRYFGCRRCHDLTYRSVQQPVASRLRCLAETLERFERDLDSRSLLTQAAAVIGTRETVRAFLADMGAR